MTAEHDIRVLKGFRRGQIREKNDSQTRILGMFQHRFKLFGSSPRANGKQHVAFAHRDRIVGNITAPI